MAQPAANTVVPHERAHTCNIPGRHASFVPRPICPDWAKIDIIGQTIILSALTPHFGSFQRTCQALKLQSNEVESFLQTHLQYQQEARRGSLIAEQWGRDQALSTTEDIDIPQQRPVLVTASSLAPACQFLMVMGYQDCVPAVTAWTQRTLVWPPDIDVSHLNFSRLDQSDVIFPQPREKTKYSSYASALGNDTRAMVALGGAWQPSGNGTPNVRISFLDLPAGTVVYGPRGSRELIIPGRFYVCWPNQNPASKEYNDLVLAKNVPDVEEHRLKRPSSLGRRDYSNHNVSDELTQNYLEGSKNAKLEGYQPDQEPSFPPLDTSANPKNIFGAAVPVAHDVGHAVPFLSQNQPQGPLRQLLNPELQQQWNSWPGDLFHFRLPRGYSIMGPQGHLHTFDPPHHERYDGIGNPHGVGGAYVVVPPLKTPSQESFSIGYLPTFVALRLKTSQRLVIIRNGEVLPRFVEPGVHEWSVREGILDLYNAFGCYDVFWTNGCYNVYPDAIDKVQGQGTGHNHGPENGQNRHEMMAHNRNAATFLSSAREAMKAPARRGIRLNHQEDQSDRGDQEAEERGKNRPNLTPRNELSSGRRSGGTQQQQSMHMSDTTEPEVTAQKKAPPKRGRAPISRRRKRNESDDDQDYTPIRPMSTRRKQPARGAGKPKSTPVPKGRRTQPTPAESSTDTKQLAATSDRTDQSTSEPKKTRPTRAAAKRKPIGPLLAALQAQNESGNRELYLTKLPKLPDEEEDDEMDEDEVNKSHTLTLRPKTAARPSTSGKAPLDYDPDETESEEKNF
ncbi:hypothetical protein F4678DRAFT_466435 [Xylaria arbuscula]|nr:hypothetical protein F4678DRAFT_466435 [Xylaria arbuscula]